MYIQAGLIVYRVGDEMGGVMYRMGGVMGGAIHPIIICLSFYFYLVCAVYL